MRRIESVIVASLVGIVASACGATPRPVSVATDDSPSEKPTAAAGSAPKGAANSVEGDSGSVVASCVTLRLRSFRSLVRPDSGETPKEVERVPVPGTEWSWVVARYQSRGTAAWLVGPASASPRVYAGNELAKSLTPTAPHDGSRPEADVLSRGDAAACLGSGLAGDASLDGDLPPGF
ncbi:hypothetical protein GCM10028801_46140 [Nocardioides maradonensis]